MESSFDLHGENHANYRKNQSKISEQYQPVRIRSNLHSRDRMHSFAP